MDPDKAEIDGAAATAKAPAFAVERALIVDAVREAAPIALAYFRPRRRSSARAWRKEDGSSVTEADMAVNRALKERLLSARPGYGWMSEEDIRSDGAADRRGAERTFVVDPIDGTRSFMEGDAVFCLSVAVVENGRPIAGVVFAPAMEALYDAVAGSGARFNEATMPARRAAASPPRVLTPMRDLQDKRWSGAAPEVARGYVQPIAHRLCLAAKGEWDGMIALKRVHEWDIAAAHVIAAESGLAVSDRAGEPLVYNKVQPILPGVLAGPEALHGDWLARRPIG